MQEFKKEFLCSDLNNSDGSKSNCKGPGVALSLECWKHGRIGVTKLT